MSTQDHTDPRVEAMTEVKFSASTTFGTSICAPLLEAADAADRAAGIVRARVDYSTVMQLDTILRRPRTNDELLHEYHERRMSEVLAALTEERP